jgi:hypothetical protein
MALTAPKDTQKRFAGQLAWERGKKIAQMPETSSALSGLISTLLSMEPLEATEWQIERHRRLVAECVAKVDGFDPADYSELPADRAAANRIAYGLQKRLNAVEYRAAQANASSFLVDEDSPEAAEVEKTSAAEAATVADADVPF